MTLVVSLRIPDGIIIATDSLSTIHGRLELVAGVQTECPLCKGKINLTDLKMPPVPIPSTFSSFAQKLFSFKKKFGVGTYGLGLLTNKSIYYHVKELELEMANQDLEGVTDVAKKICNHFDQEIKKEIRDIDKAPENFSPLGFQVVGYDKGEGKTIEINIGKNSRMQEIKGIGCTVSGDIELVKQMFELGKRDPVRGTNYRRFSLQDAVDYAEFLITATARYQRFANLMPSVGGEIDIALITPFHNFKWIKYKELTKLLEMDQ